MKKSLITMLVALCLVAALGVGATLAYLTSQSDTVTNTFTIGKVKVALTEFQKNDQGVRVEKAKGEDGFNYTRIVPGATLSKIPVATVLAESEDCYLFVKIDNPNTTITVGDLAEGWTALGNDYPGVYYRTVDYNKDNAQNFDVFTEVTVSDDINEKATFKPINIKAYAIQRLGFDTEESTVVDAWAQFK